MSLSETTKIQIWNKLPLTKNCQTISNYFRIYYRKDDHTFMLTVNEFVIFDIHSFLINNIGKNYNIILERLIFDYI